MESPTFTSIESVASAVHDCTACPLHAGRHIAVPGDGNPKCELLFIGEGPGRNEDQTGHPFVGAAGKFLDEMLASIGRSRAEVFITNVVKCRPPENRDPEPTEIETCTNLYLFRQIDLINPKLIITLGRHSLRVFLPVEYTISKVHGQPKRLKSGRVVLPLYHPAAALYDGSMRSILLADFLRIPIVLKKIG